MPAPQGVEVPPGLQLRLASAMVMSNVIGKDLQSAGTCGVRGDQQLRLQRTR